MILKKYLIYYLNIISIIYFPICYQLFALYIIYISVRYYLKNNLNNNHLDSNKDK